MLEKCVLTVLEWNWNKRLGHKKTKLNFCHHILTSSTQLQNRSFQVVERTRTSLKYQKMKYARAKRAKILFSIVKYANLWGFCCRRRRGCLSSRMFWAFDKFGWYRSHTLSSNSATIAMGPEVVSVKFDSTIAVLLLFRASSISIFVCGRSRGFLSRKQLPPFQESEVAWSEGMVNKAFSLRRKLC